MGEPLCDSLSAQQRECLRLVWRQHSSKEIALALGISKNTVDGYVAEAVARLGARDRRHAARLCFGETPPDYVGGDPARVAMPGAAVAGEEVPDGFVLRLPLRRKGAARNDLSIFERLVWIPVIGLVIAVGFGMLAVGLQAVGDLLVAIGHAVRR